MPAVLGAIGAAAPAPTTFPGLMSAVWQWIQRGYIRLVSPVADWLVKRGVKPNTITTTGLFCTIAAGVTFASGHISIGGWILSVTAVFDVLDGMVARRGGLESKFGAFYDSTLDRIADGAVLGGFTVFWASGTARHSLAMVVVCLFAIVGSYLTSYTRARAEGLGLDARVGLVQRPERIVLMAAPQALFGLAFDGLVLKAIVTLLAVTSWITVFQRIAYVRRATAEAAR
ncbi:MAG: CDP-alcohol phosphatidyltransferase family protein [Gemmatimonadaceae bacterium]|nr:CDP-alcohol phosphatidyltransferase family protein [Gemmatimonadaceae bacterium]